MGEVKRHVGYLAAFYTYASKYVNVNVRENCVVKITRLAYVKLQFFTSGTYVTSYVNK